MGHTLDISSMDFDSLLTGEWLATNALGGFASSSIPCLNTRKYHGLLVAAMAPPVRRMVLLSRVEETIVHDGWPSHLASNEYPGAIYPDGHCLLRAFHHEPFPRWAYQGEGWTLEKSLILLRGQNTVCLTYTLLGGGRPAELVLNPLFALRGIHELMYQWNGTLRSERVKKSKQHHRLPATSRTPEVFFAHDGTFESEPAWYFNSIYRREQERGYAGLEDLWTPGAVRATLAPGRPIHFVCSTDPIDLERVLETVRAQRAGAGPGAGRSSAAARALAGARASKRPEAQNAEEHLAALARAADQFIVSVPQSAGDATTAVLSHYPWSAPSVRQALIAFPGLFLVTGRLAEGRSWLLALAEKLQDGLLPSELPEDGGAAAYQGADVSLWFIAAAERFLSYSDESATARRLYAIAGSIIDAYRRGTSLGIRSDADGLLESQAEFPTSWMDAKIGQWLVTPRQGKPVELNALWHNALRVVAELATRFGDAARAAELEQLADQVKRAFNEHFWNDIAGCCFDVITDTATDAAVRPNQLLAVSLPYPVLDASRHARLLQTVQDQLLTPTGLRTLRPADPAYQPRYQGNAPHRDRAHHNGPVQPWLLGAFVTACIRTRGGAPDARRTAADLLRPSLDRLSREGLGQLPELFDAEPPHAPGGAVAAAASVAELLRCYVEDILAPVPAPLEPADPTPGLEGRARMEFVVSPLGRPTPT